VRAAGFGGPAPAPHPLAIPSAGTPGPCLPTDRFRPLVQVDLMIDNGVGEGVGEGFPGSGDPKVSGHSFMISSDAAATGLTVRPGYRP